MVVREIVETDMSLSYIVFVAGTSNNEENQEHVETWSADKEQLSVNVKTEEVIYTIVA